jgi:hypothetical protein
LHDSKRMIQFKNDQEHRGNFYRIL